MERACRWWALSRTESIINLTEDPQPAMFMPVLQSPSQLDIPGGALGARSSATGGGDAEQACAAWMRACRSNIHTWPETLVDCAVPLACGDGGAGHTGHDGRHAGDYGNLWHGRVLGKQAAAGAWEFASRLAPSAGKCCGQRWGGPLKLLAFGSVAGLILGVLATRVLAFIVYQANAPRSAGAGWGGCWRWLLLGLVATWLPAQRALSVNPLILLRED